MYDVCIIGGGINGVSIALQCVKNNHRTILFEKNDLASGASSKTSKLAHGGIRYLEQLEFSLVRECLRERNYLLDRYPALVKPVPFILPVYNNYSKIKMWLGLKLYDLLAVGTKMPRSRKINIDEAKSYVPWLNTTNVVCCYMYYDAVMLDKCIVNTIASEASDLSAAIHTHEQVINVIQHTDYVTVVTDKRQIQCKALVNVTGAWNKDLTQPTKGVHLVTNSLKSKAATILINPRDKRVFFTIPYRDNTIIGTTDDTYENDPDQVAVTDSDRNYILQAVNEFCIFKLSRDNIVDEYAGLRPLAKNISGSRDFYIHQNDRIISMIGGKFTTHRAMARALYKRVANAILS